MPRDPVQQLSKPAIHRAAACVAGTLLASIVVLAPAAVQADNIVLIEGIAKNARETTGQQLFQDFMKGPGEKPAAARVLCNMPDADERRKALGEMIGEKLQSVSGALDAIDPSLKNKLFSETAVNDADKKLQEYCNEDPNFFTSTFSIIFASCRMTMFEGPVAIDLRFLPGTDEGWLTFLDVTNGQAAIIPQGRSNVQILNQQTGVAQGSSLVNTVTPKGGTAEREISINGQPRDVTGQNYETKFNYELNILRSLGGVAALGTGIVSELAPNSLGMSEGSSTANETELAAYMLFSGVRFPRIKTEGTALIAEDVPGLGIVRDFYQRFADEMGGTGTYMDGLFNHAMLEKGMPIKLDQETRTENVGVGALGLGLPEAVDHYGMSITNIVGPVLSEAAVCEPSIVPPGFETTDVSQMMAAAQSGGDASGATASAPGVGAAPGTSSATALSAGAGPAGNATGLSGEAGDATAGLGQAMAAVSEAMQNMTPEQQAQMAEAAAGFGALFGQAAGALGAASPEAAATNAGAQAGSAAPSLTRSGPSASDLMTDDLTQTAQNMLQALGYDPGNTAGELSIETTIAISQFQAEQGLEVTGEITPQLIGILAARVDNN